MVENYKKRILLSVTGMSPAVVTETLYALVTEKGFIPTEIRVITTLQGKNQLIKMLLGIEGGRKERKGALEEFIEDYGTQYGFSHIHFDESCIEVIEDKCGEKLSDIRSPEENELASDQIVKLVGKLCQDDDTALHVSIAGGRKTMGFFLGYALSLYGRKQDSLSHVLVSAEFENQPSFFYPKPYSHKIYNTKGIEFDAKDGKVMLAEIPWVRLGLGVPDELLNNQISYSESVKNAQQILDVATLKFLSPIERRAVLFGTKKIKLSPRGYALLLSLFIAKKQQWAFGVYENMENLSRTYLGIYDVLKYSDSNMAEQFKDLDKIRRTLSDSQTDITKKVRSAFSIGKHSKSQYIPYSYNEIYVLQINLENIDIRQIQENISHIL
ncbi:TIGR02584 family CRISPR-associated protein [Caviibacterium pharyngocola]|uniref:TIGR02584 family CRISPR-associated protein n=2 Tax=Caviibacterium pharyngocola TaxID=28159 RepID=A0A2M8RUJ8_9PAST|nr:TIGR02584 family CRISPR-associated protein [Caviibacterium pharyngocola]